MYGTKLLQTTKKSVAEVSDTHGGLAELPHASVGISSGVPEELLEVSLVETVFVSPVESIVHPGGLLHDAAGKGLEDDGHALLDLFLGYETTSGVVAHLPGLGGGVLNNSSVAVLTLGHTSEEVVHSNEPSLVSMSQES